MSPFTEQDGAALDQRCVVEIPPITGTTADGYGLGTAQTGTRVVIPCLQIPPREYVDRTTGFVIKNPMSFLLLDPNTLVTDACRIEFETHTYRIKERFSADPNDSLIKVTVEREI
jgi:hypothetical protein